MLPLSANPRHVTDQLAKGDQRVVLELRRRLAYTPQVHSPSPPTPGPPSRQRVFRLRGDVDGDERCFDLAPGEHQVGKSRSADVTLAVKGVSRHHARFVVTQSTLTVEDLGSTNGTLVDGERLQKSQLTPGSEVRFGPVRLVVERADSDDSELAIVFDRRSEVATERHLWSSHAEEPTEHLAESQLEPNRRRPFLVFPPLYHVGTSPRMRALYEQMRPLLKGDLPVLISGETGVGKEKVARMLHASSDRRQGPFVAVNCAAIPAELLEAEMFGISKGVATGVSARCGKFQMAEGGSLFLDEVGEMAPALQAKLLRALQEKEITPVGAAPQTIDVRMISATNVDLARRMEDGSLRPDIFFRLAGFVLKVPALRDCREDVPGFIEHFLDRFIDETGTRLRGLTVAALDGLTEHSWPGNVRELEHELRRLVYLSSDDQVLRREHLAERITQATLPPSRPEVAVGGESSGACFSRLAAGLDSLELAPLVDELERRVIHEGLRRSQGNKIKTAKLLGVSRNGLYKKLSRLGVEVDDTNG
jgi:DNA-binding NtrC family response regulator